MKRERFVLNCCADRAVRYLESIDNFPEEVFGKEDKSFLFEIHESGSTGQPFVIYPKDLTNRAFYLTAPKDARNVVSPYGRGLAFTVNDHNYHVFANTEDGKLHGDCSYDLPLFRQPEERSPEAQ